MSDAVRLFLGVPVSMDTVRGLSELRAELKGPVADAGIDARWVAPARYHVTLKFLGWSQPEIVEALRDRVAAELEGVEAFSFATAGLGAFPDLRRPRVLWAGVEDADGRLADLAARAERAATALGFAAERRGFHPHVTLARVKRGQGLDEVLAGRAEQVFRKNSVDRVLLYESSLSSGSSEYPVRASWALESASKGRRRHTKGVERGERSTGAPSNAPSGGGGSASGSDR